MLLFAYAGVDASSYDEAALGAMVGQAKKMVSCWRRGPWVLRCVEGAPRQHGKQMSTFNYGPRGRNAMDDFFEVIRRDPGHAEKSIKAWVVAHEATTLYRAWRSAIEVPAEVFVASATLPQMALDALDGLEVIGVGRRRQILAEAMDAAVSMGGGGLVEWLSANGAPGCPAMAQGGAASSLARARKAALGSPTQDAIPRASWCAQAARHGNLGALAALERCGIGASDRAAVFDGLSKRQGSAGAACSAFGQYHPWVVAVALSIDHAARPGAVALADEIEKAWAPAQSEDQRAAWEAVEICSLENWSVRGMEALARGAGPMGPSTKARAEDSIIFAVGLAAEGSPSARRYARAAIKWVAACEGPSSGELLDVIIRAAQAGAEAGGAKAAKGFRDVSMLAGLLGKAGQRGRIDPRVAQEASRALSAAAAGSAGSTSDAKALAAMEAALAALDALAGTALAPKKAGSPRL